MGCDRSLLALAENRHVDSRSFGIPNCYRNSLFHSVERNAEQSDTGLGPPRAGRAGVWGFRLLSTWSK